MTNYKQLLSVSEKIVPTFHFRHSPAREEHYRVNHATYGREPGLGREHHCEERYVESQHVCKHQPHRLLYVPKRESRGRGVQEQATRHAYVLCEVNYAGGGERGGSGAAGPREKSKSVEQKLRGVPTRVRRSVRRGDGERELV